MANLGLFLEALRARFEDESCTQVVEGELVVLRQKGRLAKDCVRLSYDNREIAGLARVLPGASISHGFRQDLRQACLYWGLPQIWLIGSGQRWTWMLGYGSSNHGGTEALDSREGMWTDLHL